MNPEIKKLNGTWAVVIVSGPLWFRMLIGNRKVILNDNGINILKGFKWGKFKITECLGVYTLTYTELPIIDHIYFIHSDKLKGIFLWKGKYIGEFEMRRM